MLTVLKIQDGLVLKNIMPKRKSKVLHYTLIDSKVRESLTFGKLQAFDIYTYLIAFREKDCFTDMYLPMWLYRYLRETELPGYQMSLLKALRSYFRIFGTVNDEVDDELLVVRT